MDEPEDETGEDYEVFLLLKHTYNTYLLQAE